MPRPRGLAGGTSKRKGDDGVSCDKPGSGQPLSYLNYCVCICLVQSPLHAGDVPNCGLIVPVLAPFVAGIASDSGLRSVLSDHMIRRYLAYVAELA